MFDKTKKYSEAGGNSFGAKWVQDGKYYTVDGAEVDYVLAQDMERTPTMEDIHRLKVEIDLLREDIASLRQDSSVRKGPGRPKAKGEE